MIISYFFIPTCGSNSKWKLWKAMNPVLIEKVYIVLFLTVACMHCRVFLAFPLRLLAHMNNTKSWKKWALPFHQKVKTNHLEQHSPQHIISTSATANVNKTWLFAPLPSLHKNTQCSRSLHHLSHLFFSPRLSHLLYPGRAAKTLVVLLMMRRLSEAGALSATCHPLVLYDQVSASAVPVHAQVFAFSFFSLSITQRDIQLRFWWYIVAITCCNHPHTWQMLMGWSNKVCHHEVGR